MHEKLASDRRSCQKKGSSNASYRLQHAWHTSHVVKCWLLVCGLARNNALSSCPCGCYSLCNNTWPCQRSPLTNVASMELHKRKFCRNVAADLLVKCKTAGLCTLHDYARDHYWLVYQVWSCTNENSAWMWPLTSWSNVKVGAYVHCMTMPEITTDQCSKYGAAQRKFCQNVAADQLGQM